MAFGQKLSNSRPKARHPKTVSKPIEQVDLSGIFGFDALSGVLGLPHYRSRVRRGALKDCSGGQQAGQGPGKDGRRRRRSLITGGALAATLGWASVVPLVVVLGFAGALWRTAPTGGSLAMGRPIG